MSTKSTVEVELEWHAHIGRFMVTRYETFKRITTTTGDSYVSEVMRYRILNDDGHGQSGFKSFADVESYIQERKNDH